jgi:hypothetical protein
MKAPCICNVNSSPVYSGIGKRRLEVFWNEWKNTTAAPKTGSAGAGPVDLSQDQEGFSGLENASENVDPRGLKRKGPASPTQPDSKAMKGSPKTLQLNAGAEKPAAEPKLQAETLPDTSHPADKPSDTHPGQKP